MARLWIVEDDPKISLLIEMTVKKAGHETLRLCDARELESALKKERLPDLLLLDLMLREKNGFVLLKEWKAEKRTRPIPVIIISARSQERDKVMGLEMGAEDYITKPFGVREMQARIQTALRRLPQEPEKMTVGKIDLYPQNRGALVAGTPVDLTPKEFEVLLCLMTRPGETVTRGTLLKTVWDFDAHEDTTRLVDAAIKALRLKLGDDALQPRYIQTVRGVGYRLMGEARP